MTGVVHVDPDVAPDGEGVVEQGLDDLGPAPDVEDVDRREVGPVDRAAQQFDCEHPGRGPLLSITVCPSFERPAGTGRPDEACDVIASKLLVLDRQDGHTLNTIRHRARRGLRSD